jgi:hypothetical protein
MLATQDDQTTNQMIFSDFSLPCERKHILLRIPLLHLQLFQNQVHHRFNYFVARETLNAAKTKQNRFSSKAVTKHGYSSNASQISRRISFRQKISIVLLFRESALNRREKLGVVLNQMVDKKQIKAVVI